MGKERRSGLSKSVGNKMRQNLSVIVGNVRIQGCLERKDLVIVCENVSRDHIYCSGMTV